MPNFSQHDPAQTPRTAAADWHADFLTMLPSIQRLAERAFCRLTTHDREESVQACVAHCALAYHRLVELGKPQHCYAGTLVRYAVKQHRAGRKVGGHVNIRDVTSSPCQRRQGIRIEKLDDWKLALAEHRHATPAELAALRIDMEDWLRTLSPRDRELASVLAVGEPPSVAARKFRVTRGRVSQLRRQLYESWLRFTGEMVAG